MHTSGVCIPRHESHLYVNAARNHAGNVARTHALCFVGRIHMNAIPEIVWSFRFLQPWQIDINTFYFCTNWHDGKMVRGWVTRCTIVVIWCFLIILGSTIRFRNDFFAISWFIWSNKRHSFDTCRDFFRKKIFKKI